MRGEIVAQRSLLDQAIDLLLKIFKPSEELRKIDNIIDMNPDIIKAVYDDLSNDSTHSGRCGISAERIFRSAVLKHWKGYSYRELRERIHEGVALRWFSRFYTDPIPHFTSLQKAIKSIKPETWQRINEMLVQYARTKKVEKGKALRIDTTVVEANIAYPVDARLLWDSIRVLTRIMERSRQILPGVNFAFAKRTKKAKKRCYVSVQPTPSSQAHGSMSW
jgi:IS5 family transposase